MLSDYEQADVAAELFGTLDQLGTVYTEDPVTGLYTVVHRLRLECRIEPLSGNAGMRFAPSSGERAETMAFRFLYWRPDISLPEQCQVEVDLVRWQPEPGTVQPLRAGNSPPLINRCSVIRQQTVSF